MYVRISGGKWSASLHTLCAHCFPGRRRAGDAAALDVLTSEGCPFATLMLDADFAGIAPLLTGLAPDVSGHGEDRDVGGSHRSVTVG